MMKLAVTSFVLVAIICEKSVFPWNGHKAGTGQDGNEVMGRKMQLHDGRAAEAKKQENKHEDG